MVSLRHQPRGRIQARPGLNLLLLLTCCFVSLASVLYLTNRKLPAATTELLLEKSSDHDGTTNQGTDQKKEATTSVKGDSTANLRKRQEAAPNGSSRSNSKETLGAAARHRPSSDENGNASTRTTPRNPPPLASESETGSTFIDTRAPSLRAPPTEPGRRNSNDIKGIGPNMTYDDIWAEFSCSDLFNTETRPLYNATTWVFLRGVYIGVVGLSASTLTSVHGTAFRKAYVTKQSPGKGRGVFAAEAIRKGELVWVGNSHSARFRSGDDYRRFLGLVPSHDLVCDMMQFSYVQDLGPATPADKHDDDSYYDLCITVDLDDGAYMNADWSDEGNLQNVGFVKGPDGEVLGNGQEYYALRDIAVGDELLCNYDEFGVSDWEPFGL